MEDSKPAPRLMHVLRPSFSPGEAFAHTLGSIETGADGSRFSYGIRGMAYYALDASAVSNHKHDRAILAARLFTEQQHNFNFHPDLPIATKLVNEHCVAVALAVKETLAMYSFDRGIRKSLPDSWTGRDAPKPFDIQIIMRSIDYLADDAADTVQKAIEGAVKSKPDLLQLRVVSLPGINQLVQVKPPVESTV